MVLLINGPNLNLLNLREERWYGKLSYLELKTNCEKLAKQLGILLEVRQTNSESEIIDWIHEAIINDWRGIIINGAAYSHTSIAIADALEMFKGKKIAVHLSNPNLREQYRQIDYIKAVCDCSYFGEKEKSYYKAIEEMKQA